MEVSNQFGLIIIPLCVILSWITCLRQLFAGRYVRYLSVIITNDRTSKFEAPQNFHFHSPPSGTH